MTANTVFFSGTFLQVIILLFHLGNSLALNAMEAETLQELAAKKVASLYAKMTLTAATIETLLSKNCALNDLIAQRIIEECPSIIPLIKSIFDYPKFQLIKSLSTKDSQLPNILTHRIKSCAISSSGKYAIVVQDFRNCKDHYAHPQKSIFEYPVCESQYHPVEWTFFLIDLEDFSVHSGPTCPADRELKELTDCSFSLDDAFFFVAGPFHLSVFQTATFFQDKQASEIVRIAFNKTMDSLECKNPFVGAEEGIPKCVTFDNAVKNLYVAGEDGILKIDLTTREQLTIFTIGKGRFTHAVVHPNDRFLIAAHCETEISPYSIIIFNVVTNQICKIFNLIPEEHPEDPSDLSTLLFDTPVRSLSEEIKDLYMDSSGQVLFLVKKPYSCLAFKWSEISQNCQKSVSAKSELFQGLPVEDLPHEVKDNYRYIGPLEYPSAHASICSGRGRRFILADYYSGQKFDKSAKYKDLKIARSKNAEYMLIIESDNWHILNIISHKIPLPALLLIVYLSQATDNGKKAASIIEKNSFLFKILSSLDEFSRNRITAFFKLDAE